MTAHISTPEQRERFRQAAAFVILFGKYKGRTLDEIGTSVPGLSYLAWLRDTRARDFRAGDKGAVTDRMLAVYLDDPAIADAVASLPVRR